MKKTLYIFFIFLAAVGCKEDPLTPYEDARPNGTGETVNPGGGGGGGAAGGTFTATVAGDSWSADMITASEMMGLINIVATNSSSSTQVMVSFNEATSVGTHNFDGFSIIGQYANMSAQVPIVYSAEGPAIEIISIDPAAKKAKGIFTFTAVNASDSSQTVKVTNGAFDIKYSSFSF